MPRTICKRHLWERLIDLEAKRADDLAGKSVMIGRLCKLEREVAQLKRDKAEMLAAIKRLTEDNAALHDLRANQVQSLLKRVERLEATLSADRKLRIVG
jgi:hypothetical protein